MAKVPPPETVSRVVRWGILLFLAYALWTGTFRSHPPVRPISHTAATTQNATPDCERDTNPLQNFALIASSLIPTMVPSVHVNDIKVGEGAGAVCGQHATLRYQYALESGDVVFSDLKNPKPIDVTIGGNTLLHGLELGILGMKAGGERSIAFPPALGLEYVTNIHNVRDSDKFALSLELLRKSVLRGQVSLVSLSPEIPVSTMPLRTIDRQFSGGARAQCGDTVRVQMTLWKTDGTKIFSTEDNGTPAAFTLGQSQVAYGIEQAVMGMSEGSQRTAIIPAAYAKPLVHSDATGKSPLASLPDEILIGELHVEHIGQETAAAVSPSSHK